MTTNNDHPTLTTADEWYALASVKDEAEKLLDAPARHHDATAYLEAVRQAYALIPNDTSTAAGEVSVTVRPGEDYAEALRIAKLPGARVRYSYDGITTEGPVHSVGEDSIACGASGVLGVYFRLLASGDEVTVTAPAPKNPWDAVDHIEPGHIVSYSLDGEPFAYAWRDHFVLGDMKLGWNDRRVTHWRVIDPTTGRIVAGEGAGQ